jgi:aminocarboxymuconate-semialdehyde decarboxylase
MDFRTGLRRSHRAQRGGEYLVLVGDLILRDWIGRPYDTGICVSRMLLADTLASYPNVRVVIAHSGGPIPMLLGRLDAVYETFERRAAFARQPSPGGGPSGGPGGEQRRGPPSDLPAPPADAALKPSLEGAKPSARLGQLYLDTASYHPTALRAAIDTVGVERIVVGTDYPPAGRSPRPTIELVQGLDLTSEERDKILSGNASQLLDRTLTPASS